MEATMKTIRGQSAMIVANNGKFSIELYANGEWVKPCSGYDKEFDSMLEAAEYFEKVKNTIHC